jgi:Protein of unknown function (DUF1572)
MGLTPPFQKAPRVRVLLASIEAEYRRYRSLGDAALSQLTDAQLSETASENGNSVAVIVRHLAGNLASRFEDFLTTDGEKPWRRREEEFTGRIPERTELMDHWMRGWDRLFGALGPLSDADLERPVRIRGQTLPVHEALHRSLAHTAYHVGQIVFLAKGLRGDRWVYLSIPPGESEVYNENPSREKPDEQAAALDDKGVEGGD